MSLDKLVRPALFAIVLYFLALFTAWVWFHPHFVSERVHKRISIGAKAADVEKEFHVKPYDFPASAYCGKDAPANTSRIAIDETGRIPLFPLPMAMVTTTLFCFDGNNTLVGLNTERWLDEL